MHRLLASLLIPVLLAAAGMEAHAAPSAPAPVVIEHVTVLPMTRDGARLADRTVVIREGRIASITPSAGAKVPAGARRVNGRGKFLMPGLTDMHVHLENERIIGLFMGAPLPEGTYDPEDLYLPFVANGVLQLFDPAASAESIGRRGDLMAGRLLGPRIELAAMVDGAPPIWPFGFAHTAATAEDGRQFVRDMKADGFRFVKTYSLIQPEAFDGVLEEAKKQGVRVVGHIPGRKSDQTQAWIKPGFEMVVHAEEFAYQAKDPAQSEGFIARYVDLAKHNGTVLTSTLTTNERIVEQMRDPSTLNTRPEMKYVHPVSHQFWTARSPYANAPPARIAMLDKVVTFNAKLVKAFADAGIPVFPGTDAMVPGMVAGFSLHDELEALARAGLANDLILANATRVATEWLGVGADRGTVEAGKRADLLLLDADPLADVSNTRRINTVILGGRVLPRAELDRRMTDLVARYARMKPVAPAPGARPGGGRFDVHDHGDDQAAEPATPAPLDDPAYARAQRLVDVGGGRRMNLYCTGAGGPTVVLESGLSDPNLFWAAVQPQVARTNRVCSYDRAGMGFSDESPRASTPDNIVSDVRALLAKAGEKGPYVLVGHSFGGLLVRYWAGTRPEEVAGLVLVDSASEEQVTRYQAADGGTPNAGWSERFARHRRCAASASPQGYAPGSELETLCVDAVNPALGPRLNAAIAAMANKPSYQRAQLSEMQNIYSGVSTAQAVAARRFLGDLPMIVLSRVEPPGKMAPAEKTPRNLTLWAMHDELSALSSRSEHRGVSGTDHYIQVMRPDAVAAAIRDVTAQARP